MKHEFEQVNEKSIALYCRVSTDEQAREGVSLDEQQERLKAYCRAMGWSTEPILFVDDGYSAKNMDRPQLNRLLQAVEKGSISRILVTKLDRLSRRLLDLLKLIDVFQEYDVSFASISESFDTNTPSGRLTLQVLGAVAEFERERIRERVFENMVHAANQGKWLTQSPYGYRLENKELVIYEPEAQIVRDVYDMYLNQGIGYRGIARKLNDAGILSKQKKEWSLRAIKLMLTNPAYKGTLVWNRVDTSKSKRNLKDNSEWVVVDDALPVIIDKKTWERVQHQTNKKQMAPRAQTSPHLLGGLLKCGKCGSGMSIGWSGSKNKRYRVYVCSAHKNKGTCTSKQYRADEVEEWFKEGLQQLLNMIGYQSFPQLIQKATQQNEENVEQKIRTAKNRYKRKVEAYTAGLIELEDLNEEKQRLEKLIEEADQKSSVSQIDISYVEKMVKEKIKNALDAIDILPVPEAKSLIKTIVEKVIIPEEKDIEIVLRID
ncbi:site-specific DNA recombinase [Aneurinibacillus soli]|uniref:Putative DNA-invertase from lambdoid prophage Rac n=1 Tax=Aneurinibacillus soli TaxID=1500254 RepID=A0A0U4WMT2_9BACL|nr:recombinase family protein [Aneurinibacillus soli]PYE58649.1 site-specific DNA recombinase [Aneurinibacillus soli]BAU29592.1 putative DNA-invertase from lambdoid prophage Rac [Aneurinibacillus soli]